MIKSDGLARDKMRCRCPSRGKALEVEKKMKRPKRERRTSTRQKIHQFWHVEDKCCCRVSRLWKHAVVGRGKRLS